MKESEDTVPSPGPCVTGGVAAMPRVPEADVGMTGGKQ